MKVVRLRTDEPDMILYVMGDTHLEHPNVDNRKIKKHIKLIKDSGERWTHLGDWVDAINPIDKRFSIEDKRASVIASYDLADELFTPIASHCVAILRGNHGTSWSRREGDMLTGMARRWQVPYLGYCGFITVKLPDRSYKIWLHHGAGGGRKRGAKTIRLNDWAQFVDADIYLQGHTHTFVTFNDSKLTTRGTKTRHYGNISGYIRSYRGKDNYVEEWGLPPQPTGMIRLSLGETVKIEAVI